MHRQRGKRPEPFTIVKEQKMFTLSQQAVSSPASRGRKGEIGEERELRQWVRKLLEVGGWGWGGGSDISSIPSKATN